MKYLTFNSPKHISWNQGKLAGQKRPLKLEEIWAIRSRLQRNHGLCDLALFDLTVDGKLRCCDLIKPRVGDVAHGTQIAWQAMVMQQKTRRPVQFDITEQSRDAIAK